MKILKQIFSHSHFAELSLFVALVFTGGFSEFFSCVISVLVSALLIIKIIKNGYFRFKFNTTCVAFLLIALWYLISVLFAVDSGMAFLGFLKFLPAVLYMALLMQEENATEKVRNILPYFALILGVISLALMYIPGSTFMVEGRLAGFFQYPNTFAMFLLTAQLCVISKRKMSITDIIIAVVLIILILFTMSRAVFVLAALSNIVILFVTKGKKTRLLLSILVISTVALIVLFYPSIKAHEVLGRFLSLSVFESTFAGRLLYWYDALPLIIKHPFGLGYMGYYYMEQSIQTGVYAVKYIHNDILQLILDVGFIPCIAFLAAIIKSLCSKRLELCHKIILVTFLLHILFDFDLQFTAMLFILLAFLDIEDKKEHRLSKERIPIVLVTGFLGVVSLYFSVALAFEYFGNYKASHAMYPFNTQVKIQLLTQADDISSQSEIADEILRQNEYVQIAYSAKATQAFSNGDFGTVMKYKDVIFDIAPYSYEEYENYAYMLISGIYLYEEAGDYDSAGICTEKLLELDDKLSSLKDRTSYLGNVIVDKPVTEFSDEIKSYIQALEAKDD